MQDREEITKRKYNQEDIDSALSRLEKCAICSNELSEEDVKQLHLIIEAYKSWQVLGRAAKWLVMFLAGLSAFFVAMQQFKESLKLWLQ